MAGAHSDVFQSDIGVPIGDPASPTLWDLSFADFKLHLDPDDLRLGGVRHLNTFARWCGNNMLEANATKSWVMIFGPIPSVIPVLTLNGIMVRYTDRFAYVGITFQSTARNIFASYYAAKASTARGTGYSVLGIESYIGDLPPKEGRLLYMACIDPHLVSAADIIVDVDDTALALLEKVQRSFLRRLLGLDQHSMRAPLFTELGLYAKVALEDSYDLYLNNHPGYWMDLVYALRILRFPVELPSLPSLTAELCEKLGKAVTRPQCVICN
ncbi:hypothetical protein DFH08DRAFT_979134 [Mycena albidolilacea]|uniref:Reverse transcriptase domain-containing protein n=1 Tax=Mycena albidolilacea TaxID=1033008 RepID=A0AAD7E7F0_9AGAR|nr:hypothetical protein DFH08DRAFT_979134 [Mycena albidolilacea]